MVQVLADKGGSLFYGRQRCCPCSTVKAVLLLWERTFFCDACGLVLDRGLHAVYSRISPLDRCGECVQRRKTPVDGIEVLLSRGPSRRKTGAGRAPALKPDVSTRQRVDVRNRFRCSWQQCLVDIIFSYGLNSVATSGF
jgi:hypothetical protein